ncbi:hypothetical protein BpHYR1_000839 [Brachionus plicatilis]|uniref:Uncharacterized protein n=1 Tax=Brachionus plicatilis TaxID=10195 RepID=A0A3M7RBD5_BRAPC|nr:hypothetical protein BpHYR1_000839 [Brachionus plicatilis]
MLLTRLRFRIRIMKVVCPRHQRHAEERVNNRAYLPGESPIIIKVPSYSRDGPPLLIRCQGRVNQLPDKLGGFLTPPHS